MFDILKRLFRRKKKPDDNQSEDYTRAAETLANATLKSHNQLITEINEREANPPTPKQPTKIHTPANFARDAILAILDRPMTITEIALVIPGGEYERTKRQLARMVTKGQIARVERGLYARSPSKEETTTRKDS